LTMVFSVPLLVASILAPVAFIELLRQSRGRRRSA
jgi:hypothetical protein